MLYFVSFIFILTSIWVGNAALALFLGIILASYKEVPVDFFSKKYGSIILQTGIVFLGGSLSLDTFFEINSSYFLLISLYVIGAFSLVLLVGRIVIGVLVNDSDIPAWNEFVQKIGYKSWKETDNPAYKLFLGAEFN